MVLLTSSAVSVAVSSGVICLFTFLLFLSGYVLQQQSVRALQLALHPPPQPTPTLPTYFQDLRNGENGGEASGEEDTEAQGSEKDEGTTFVSDATEVSADQAVLAQTEPDKDGMTESKKEDIETPPASIPTASVEAPISNAAAEALIVSVALPSDICSAILLYQTISQSTGSNLKARNLVFYPSFWQENGEGDTYSGALHLLDQAKIDLDVEFQAIVVPLEYHSTATATARYMKENILSSREVHDFARALYLQTPGLVLDAAALVDIFSASIEGSWDIASPTTSPQSSMLLFSKSLTYTPSSHHLVAEAMTLAADESMNKDKPEAFVKEAAYVVFNDEALKETNEDVWYSGLVKRYLRETEDVCRGARLKEEDVKGGLKRRDIHKRDTRKAA